MNYLVIDGNSLINRAFYGIKLLTAKDGHYTNAVFGFMNMLQGLVERTSPAKIAAAFDVKQPTFRHERYDAYKAGRRPMPPELHEQLEPLKDLLRAYGCSVIECPGFEADDILGTLSASTPEGDLCFIATGDRDALQLIRKNVHVLLTTTKMGQTQTSDYGETELKTQYGLTPEEMIELKALQGDSSDNIPGVAGIGPKTAGELIQDYHSIDYIYAHLDELDVTKGVRAKLEAGKESAYLSRELGTICLKAPLEHDLSSLPPLMPDEQRLKAELLRHEMFKMISRLGLDRPSVPAPHEGATDLKREVPLVRTDADGLKKSLSGVKEIWLHSGFTAGEKAGVLLFAEDAVIDARDDEGRILSTLFSVLENDGIKKYTVNCKALFKLALAHGREMKNVAFDVSLAAYLLNPNASTYAVGETALSYKVPLMPPAGAKEDDPDLALYAETAALPLLCKRLSLLLEENAQTSLLKDVEIPLANVLSSMELEGMAVDRKSIEDYSVVLSSRIEELQKQIWELAGEEFNINSPKQLGVILFEKLNLPGKKKTKSGYSTNAEVLESLRFDYPIVDMILEYRAHAKLKSTYCDGLLAAVQEDGRVRSTFNQTETRTGRLSSTEPNLQNIPVRTALGREFRKFFTAREGFVIVDADYSQIELRVLASLSDDKTMIDCFNTGVDIHTATAAKVFGVPETEVTHELRSKAKAVNFGIVYGIGAFSLAKDIHSTRAEADSFIKAYLALYSSIDAYMKRSITDAKEKGYAETLFHRRRALPELASSNPALRAFGERVARNMPIQGTAADIIKIAMVKVYDRLEKELPEAKLIMQVHDELMLEAPALLARKAAAILKEEMENAVKLKVRLSVDVGVGKTWYEAKG